MPFRVRATGFGGCKLPTDIYYIISSWLCILHKGQGLFYHYFWPYQPSIRELMSFDKRQLVLHVMYRFDTGGLENGVVNLINHVPTGAYRHTVGLLDRRFRN